MKENNSVTPQFAAERFTQEEQIIKTNLILETQVGSVVCGCDTSESDVDILGIFMDDHKKLFPQMYGYINGFDKDIPSFKNVEYKGERNRIILPNKKEAEGEWHAITDFFSLVENGSPNLTEVLFARRNYVRYGHKIGFIIRDNRKLFLSMKMFHSFCGFAFNQLKRIRGHVIEWKTKKTCDNPNRRELFEKFSYDVKQAYQCLKLLDYVDQMIKIGDIDLMRNNRELISMRNGLWGSWEDFDLHVGTKLRELQTWVNVNPVAVPLLSPHEVLHELLMNCIEEYYGSLDKSNITEYITTKKVYDMFSSLDNKLSMLLISK